MSKTKTDKVTKSSKKALGSDPMDPKCWQNNPLHQMKRFESAVALAQKNGQSSFTLDGVPYNTQYVSDFINAYRSDELGINRPHEYYYDILKQSGRTETMGQCFGENFSDAKECFNVMREIFLERKICGEAISLARLRNSEQFDNDFYKTLFGEAEKFLKEKTVQYNGKKYSALIDIPVDKQWTYFKLLDKELCHDADMETKSFLRAACLTNSEAENLYKLIDFCGNPKVRNYSDSPLPVRMVAAGRSHFLPSIMDGGTCYLADYKHLISELAHAFRNKNNSHGEAAQFLGDGFRDIITLNSPGFTPSAQDQNYSDKTKMEYDTHKIVEQALHNFIKGKIPSIDQMYAQIDMKRKRKGTPFKPTEEAEQRIQKGYEEIQDAKTKKDRMRATLKQMANKDPANPKAWPNTPSGQMKRFECAAALAETNGKPNFSLDGVSYDTQYVSDFIETYNSDEQGINKPIDYCYEILTQSGKTGSAGQCFGKSFSNATECYDVMCEIRSARQLCGEAVDWARDRDVMPKGKKKLLDAAEVLLKEKCVEYNGKKYDLSLDMPIDKQWSYFRLLNDEIQRDPDLETKSFLRAACTTYDDSERLYQLMEVCGNPKVRKLDASLMPVKWASDGRSHYVNGTCYLEKPTHLVDELAHAFRDTNNTFGEFLQVNGDAWKDVLTLNSWGFTENARNKNYSDKTKVEYDAHEIVEPTLRDFLNGKIPSIEQMYARIDMQRKEKGTDFRQTSESEKRTNEGYLEIKRAEEAEKKASEGYAEVEKPEGVYGPGGTQWNPETGAFEVNEGKNSNPEHKKPETYAASDSDKKDNLTPEGQAHQNGDNSYAVTEANGKEKPSETSEKKPKEAKESYAGTKKVEKGKEKPSKTTEKEPKGAKGNLAGTPKAEKGETKVLKQYAAVKRAKSY